MTMKMLSNPWQRLAQAGLMLGTLLATRAALAVNDLPGGPSVRQLDLAEPVTRIAEDQHPHISLEPGDLVIFSSKTIPGNEKEVSRVLNNLARLDIDMVTGDDDLVHSSGHPRQGELSLLYDWLKPKALIPMHGEPRHLRAHRIFAQSQGIRDVLIPRDGIITRLAPGPLEDIDEAPCGRLPPGGDTSGPAKPTPSVSLA